jgi:hypothetical protein
LYATLQHKSRPKKSKFSTDAIFRSQKPLEHAGKVNVHQQNNGGKPHFEYNNELRDRQRVSEQAN